MKRNLFLLLCAMLTSVGMWATDAYQTYLTSEKGWTQVTDLSSLTLSDYYFAIVSNDNTDLMVKMAAGVENTGNHAMWYMNAADPIKDNTYLWIIENNNTENYVGYTFRNVDYSKRVLQTTEGASWFCRTNWEQNADNKWCSYACTLSGGAYTIQTLANGGTNYLGLWTYSNGYVSGQELAGNKSGDQIGKFLIYAISRTTAASLAVAASEATYSTPYELGYFLFGRASSDYTGATGLYNVWNNDTYNVMPEKYNDNVAPSTGDKVTKTITNAPNGYHVITVLANAAWISGRGSVGTTVPTVNDNSTVVTINGVSQNVPVRTDGSFTPVTLTFPTYVTDNNITFKITNNDAAAFWFVWDIKDTFYGAASASNPINVTSWITNPSFSSAYTTGWTLDGTAPNDYNSTYGAYENYHRIGGLHQDLTDLPNGVYKATMQAAVNGAGTFYLYATSANGTTKTFATAAPGANFAATAKSMSEDANYGLIETYAIVTDGTLTIGHYESSSSTWPVFDNYTLTYYGTGTDAYALMRTSEATKANTNISAMTSSAAKTSVAAVYNATPSTVEEYVANINTLTTYAQSYSELLLASKVSAGAESIADVEYTENEGEEGAHTTFATAITTHTSAVAAATSASAISTATTTLQTAIKTYIAAAEPKNEGEYFDITCLMANPDFDENTITGWKRTIDQVSGYNAVTSYSCNEVWNCTFNFYQDLESLPNGSYQLSVQAFSRPGDNGNTSAGAYYDYKNGTNAVTAKLYVNSDESVVGNIYSYTGNTTVAKVTGNDFHCTIGDDNYWVPNNMQGASLYFADGAYNTTVAALVTEGTLRVGFKDETLTTHQWTIFDNFRLYYYGSSQMIYLKQYLPQLEASITSDYLENGLYGVLQDGQTERDALETANAADADDLDTEDELQDAIDDIIAARDNFVAAKTAYDNLNTALTTANAYTSNVGTGVFQITTAAGTTLSSQITTSQGVYDTGTASKADVETETTTLNTAVTTATSTLNAPAADTRYWVTIHDSGKAWDGYAITFIPDGRSGEGNYNVQYLYTANENYCQALKFTAVEGKTNTYYISAINKSGTEQYLTGKLKGYSSGNNNQIRTTDDDTKALEITVSVTANSGAFKLINETEKEIARNSSNPDNGVYADGDVGSSFTIAEASEATANLTVNSGKLGTFVAPFDVELPSGVKAYSATADATTVTLDKVADGGETLSAGTPVIVYGDGISANKNFSGYSVIAANPNEGALTGLLVSTTVPDGSYVLQTQTIEEVETQAFYLLDGAATGTLNRCYLTAGGSGEARLTISFDEATIINAIEEADAKADGQKDGKYLENGKIVIVKNGMKYSANGQILK